MNYFNPEKTAERYSKGRPYFHENTIKKIHEYKGINPPVNKALDVACGTGLSSKALRKISKEIYGIDTSEHMLKYAKEIEGIQIQNSAAEQLPFEEKEFDLITVCSGVHWFNIDKFLKEAHRVLKDNAWLILYDNYFKSEMEGIDNFREKFALQYLEKFPSPPRNNKYDWSNENLNTKGFNNTDNDRFINQVSFRKKDLILYLTTQSNITAAVSSGKPYSEIENWLDQQLSPFFKDDDTHYNFSYGNWVSYVQKI